MINLVYGKFLSSYLIEELLFSLNCDFFNFEKIFSLLIIKPIATPEIKAPAVNAPIKKADFGLQFKNLIT